MAKSPHPMYAYVRTLTPDQKIALAKKSGTSVDYLHMLGKTRQASTKLAQKLHKQATSPLPPLPLATVRPDIWG